MERQDSEGRLVELMRQDSERAGLAESLVLVLLQLLALESLGGASPLLNLAEASLDPFGQRFTARALHSFHQLLHQPIGPDPEADGALGHTRCRRGMAKG